MIGLVQRRFPADRRSDPIELPEALIRDILPEGDYHIQEERRLFYVGMTRAKEQLILTAAYDRGGKTRRKISQFVLEALNLPDQRLTIEPAAMRALIEREAPREPLPVLLLSHDGVLHLDPHGADDYLTCPLKYQFSHVLRLPVMRHHQVIYGSAIHRAVEAFFKARMQDQPMDEAALLRVFNEAWQNEGFLTQEHERLRKQQGEATLRRFFAEQAGNPETPSLIEERFSFRLEEMVQVSGRWDRVDCDPQRRAAVIIDYKTAEVEDQKQADRRLQQSFQLKVYALGWLRLYGYIPTVELRFIDSGWRSGAQFSSSELEKTAVQLQSVAEGVKAHRFVAKPTEFDCRWCAYQAICPKSEISRLS
jgi:DNA helicase-2/ATP-dependent DNA helicase PcrA